MKKDVISAGYAGLVSQPTQTPAEQPEQAAKSYKTVCYSISPEIAEKMKQIARFDRKRLNAVVTEAFAAYIEKWKPTTEKAPEL